MRLNSKLPDRLTYFLIVSKKRLFKLERKRSHISYFLLNEVILICSKNLIAFTKNPDKEM